jgi:hypothetical protein
MTLLDKIKGFFSERSRRANKKSSGYSVIVPPEKAKDARNLEGTKLADCPLMGCSSMNTMAR